MEKRLLGQTGLEVSRVGVGLAQIGQLDLDAESRVAKLLNHAIDSGINFFDTAAAYGNSEELIGRSISHRRDEFVLATKCGHWASLWPWTAQTIVENIDQSLRRLKTDHIDILQIHSAPVEILERGEVTRALIDARNAGKTRFVSYSGDNEAALWAVESGQFATLQTSFNLVDQRARTRLFPSIRDRRMGLIIKRPIANGAWGGSLDYAGTSVMWRRIYDRAEQIRALGPVPGAPEDRIRLAMGFTFAHQEVDVGIVGTTNPDHLASNIRLFEEGLSIPDETVQELYNRFEKLGTDWEQLT